MKRIYLIIALTLMMVSTALAFPGEGIIGWLSDQTGLTEQVWKWVGSIIIIPGMGWLMSKSTWDQWEKQIYVIIFNGAKKLNLFIIGFPVAGVVWEKFIEAFVIKWIFGVFRILAVIPIAIAAGFNSEGESLAGDK